MPAHLIVWLILSALLSISPALAETNPDRISDRWASWFSDEDSSGRRPRLSPLPYHATLIPTFFALPLAPPRLRDLAPETDRARTEGLLATTTWLKGSFSTETEVANNQGGSGWLQSKIPGDTRGDGANRMMRIGVTATAGTVRYGLSYRTAGQAFHNGPDQALRELWGEWRSGTTTLRSAVGQQWNNVAGDSTRSRLEQTYGRVGLMWSKPDCPNLSLTYARNSLNSALDPIGIAPQKSQSHSLEAALAYNSLKWNARLASTYMKTSDLLRNGAEHDVTMQILTASIRPLNTLAIVPTLMYRSERQERSGVRIDSPTASLALQYKQSHSLLLSATGNYSGTRSSDGLIDTETIGGKGMLSWNVQHTKSWATLLSLEASYNRLANRATPSADTEDISGVVRIVLAAL